MLVMIAEVKAGQQRSDPTELVRPRPMLVGERGVIMPVRQISAEVEKLQR